MEYKCAAGFIDNRMVKDNHQQGIERVKQRGHDKMDVEGHKGSMAGGWKHKGESKSHFGRSGAMLTPRKA